VYGIVTQSGGYIDVDSEAGAGTTFKIYLPRTAEATPPPQHQQHGDTPPAHGEETILLVEDEPGVRSLACEILRKNGYNVLEAGDGEQALELAQNHGGAIDLLVSDVVMPRLGGGQLAKKLAPLYPDMKVLFLSGYTDSSLVHHGVVSKEVECLTKPYSAEALACKVREILDRHATQSGRERRTNQRRTPRKAVKVQCLKGTHGLGSNLAMELQDLSVGGAAVVLKSPLEKGQEVEFVIIAPGHPAEIKRLAEVAWLQPGDKKGYRVGLKFRRRLNFAQVMALT
jgi:CheY-like chemotaxis protein